jgi:hypothetical protein
VEDGIYNTMPERTSNPNQKVRVRFPLRLLGRSSAIGAKWHAIAKGLKIKSVSTSTAAAKEASKP